MAKIPSTNAKLPNSRTSTASVAIGMTIAKMPKMIATAPRIAIAHQFLATASVSISMADTPSTRPISIDDAARGQVTRKPNVPSVAPRKDLPAVAPETQPQQ